MRTGLSRPGTQLGGGFARLGGRGPLDRGRSTLRVASGLLREPGGWRRALGPARWLLVPLLLLLLLLVSSQLDPSTPPAPQAHVGSIHVPKPPPFPSAPKAPTVPTVPTPVPPTLPGIGFPNAPTVNIPSPPDLSSGGSSPGTTPAPPEEPYQPRTITHLTVHHIHHLRMIWQWNWLLIALVAAAVAAAYLMLRRPRQDKLLRAATVASVALALAALAVTLGVHQVPGPGTYHSNPIIKVGEHYDSMENRIIELEKPIDHYHPPLDLKVALLLLAAGLTELAIPSSRVLVRAMREAQKRRQAERAAARLRRSARGARP